MTAKYVIVSILEAEKYKYQSSAITDEKPVKLTHQFLWYTLQYQRVSWLVQQRV